MPPTSTGGTCASGSSSGLLGLATAPSSARCPDSAICATASRTRIPSTSRWGAVPERASCLAFVLAFREVFCRQLPIGFSYNIAMAEQATNVLLPTGGAGGSHPVPGSWVRRAVAALAPASAASGSPPTFRPLLSA